MFVVSDKAHIILYNTFLAPALNFFMGLLQNKVDHHVVMVAFSVENCNMFKF